jgi:hypothetical protein
MLSIVAYKWGNKKDDNSKNRIVVFIFSLNDNLLHHAAHAWSTAHWHLWFWSWLVADY